MAVTRRKDDAMGVGGVDVMEGIERRFHVASRRLMIVQREEGVSLSQIWTHADCEPADTTNKALICLFVANLNGRVVVCITLRDGIDGEAGSIGCCGRSGRFVIGIEAFNKVTGEA